MEPCRIPGFPKVLARELVERQVEQAMAFSPTVCLDEKVTHLAPLEDGVIELQGDHRDKVKRRGETALKCGFAFCDSVGCTGRALSPSAHYAQDEQEEVNEPLIDENTVPVINEENQDTLY